LFLTVLLLPGCGTDEGTNPAPEPPPEPNGRIEVTLIVGGYPPDPDGVHVSVGAGEAFVLQDGESHVFADLVTGSHAVHVGGVAWHCDLAGESTRVVDVLEDLTTQLPITVACRNVGVLVAGTHTAGSSADPDGYVVELEGQAHLPVSDAAAAIWPEVEPGQYQVSLVGLADHCWMPGERVVMVDVAAADTARVNFDIACPPFHDHVAFGSDLDGDVDLCWGRSNGTSPVNLTPGDLDGNDPSWSPDGLRIAFTGGPPDGIWVLELDGSEPVWISEGRSPQWSPDGSRILFVGGWGVHVMDADGSNRTHVIEAYCESPQWSPDGLQVAFTSGQDCGEGDPEFRKSIYVANLDGTGKRRVTSGATAERYDTEPAWHPGMRIAFVGYGDGLGSGDIYTVDPDGSGLLRLTHSPYGSYAYEPQWSPDGARVAFSHDPGPSGRQICVVGSDGSGYRCLTRGDFWHGYPSWSPGP